MSKTIITIAGLPGSGKSSTANKVAETLDFGRFSSGDLFRKIALEKGMSISEINLHAEKEKEIDHLVDSKLREIGKTEQNLVIDSRIAFHWIPNSLKVFLKLNPAVAAERIFKHIQTEGRLSQDAESLEQVQQDVETRIQSECKRYQNLYGINYLNESQYDLVVDTAKYSLEEVVNKILEAYQKHIDS